MEASSQLAFQVTQERLVEPRAASGTVALGDAEQQRQLRAIEIGLAAQGLVDGSRSHLQQLGAARQGCSSGTLAASNHSPPWSMKRVSWKLSRAQRIAAQLAGALRRPR